MDMLLHLDHPYSRHWSESYKTDHSHAKPIYWILPSCRRNAHVRGLRFRGKHYQSSTAASSDGSEDEIDVESLDEVMSPYMPGRSYDVQRARLGMNETERLMSQVLLGGKLSGANMRTEQAWEDHINKSTWSLQQNKLYSKVTNVLEDEKLARLAFKGVNNEPVARRLSLDRSAACLRRIFAEFSWDQKLLQWLHSLLTSKLPALMLASYLDLIQTLRSKVPALVERMIMQTSTEGSAAPDTLAILLKRPWEPVLMKYPLAPKQRLYGQPIILLIPNSPYAPSPTLAHRKRFWNSHLSQLGKVIAVQSPEKTPRMTILSYVEQLTSAVRSKITFYQNKYPGRSVVLLGWHTASILSCHVSLVEKVSAVVCLGFPTKTLNGPRATVDDIFCDMTTPTLFVVGEEADSSTIDKMEDFREQLLTRCENHLLAIPGADDGLRVSDKVKKKACVTQQMVDRMMLDYVSRFFSETLIKNAGNWHVLDSVYDEDDADMATLSSLAGRRKRAGSEDMDLAEIKRRRISSMTSAKITQILSAQSSGKRRDGTRTPPIQGVTYNLQTGSLSGLATVPNVLSRSLSKPNDPMQALKTKGGGRSKNQPRSITVDLAKDAASQIKFGKSYGASPDPAILASGSQTEAAVATILGGDSLTGEKLMSPPRAQGKKTPLLQGQLLTTASSSAFTRISHAGDTTTPLPTETQQAPTAKFATSGQYPASKSKPAYTNVKFNSTLISKPAVSQTVSSGTSTFSTINRQHWAGIVDSSSSTVTKGEMPRKYPYLPPNMTEKAAPSSSRSRKEERETMQATAFLEQLTSGLVDDADRNSQSSASQGSRSATSYRRSTYDAACLADGASRGGRGRVRTRGGSSQPRLSRDGAAQKRRNTVAEERLPSAARYYQKPGPGQGRYVVSPSVTTAIAATGKANRGKPVTLPSAAVAPKTTAKPSILPVYTFTQPAVTGIKIQSLASTSIVSKPTMTKAIHPVQVAASVKKPSKVIVGQRLPVKFPGPVPGSSYTFVTIPALTGSPLPAAGQKTTLFATKRLSSAGSQAKLKPGAIKYSVVPKSVTIASSQPRLVVARTQAQPVTLRTKTIPKSLISSSGTVPMPSVVLHKLGSESTPVKADDGNVSESTTEK